MTDTYIAIVRFERSISDDASVIDSHPPTPQELAKQLALELQEAYDELSIAGQFQIETISIDGVVTQIEGVKP